MLVCTGCLEIDVRLREPNVQQTPAPPPLAPVSVDQVTPENARDMAQALWDELDREEAEQDRASLERAMAP
jgi:hypothetical protein